MSQRDIIYVIIDEDFFKNKLEPYEAKGQIINNISSNQETDKKLTLNSDLFHYKQDEKKYLKPKEQSTSHNPINTQRKLNFTTLFPLPRNQIKQKKKNKSIPR